MSSVLNILHLEDNDADAELVAIALRRHNLSCEIERVTSREEFMSALEHGELDLILSDFSIPDFDGLSALRMAREKRPALPFVFVSGTIGEETAIEALQCGASDYVFKHRLPRLAPAVQRAVADAARRQELQRTEQAMIQSEHKYRQLFECLGEAALLAEVRTGRIVDSNRQAELLLGRSRSEILGMTVERVLHPDTLTVYRGRLLSEDVSSDRQVFDGEIFAKDGRPVPVAISAAPIVLYDRRFILALYRDVTDRKVMELEIERLKNQLIERQNLPHPGNGGSR
jgi:PAS domain S-box-containing protein